MVKKSIPYKPKEFWDSFKPPMIPNEYEAELIRQRVKGKVLLLGETKLYQEFCHEGLDLYPTGFAKQGNWFDIEGFYDTIILDGGLALYGFELLEVLKHHCSRFISRVFGKYIETTRNDWTIAKYFIDEFPGASEIINAQDGIYIVVWDF